MTNKPASDYDSPWKEAMTIYFEPFMAFLFPDFHQAIDWDRGYETLDAELQEIIRDAETGRLLADKLVRVWLKTGENTLVLVHLEVQSQVQSDFEERMYIYNHRLFDRYRQQVFSLAVLGDDDPNWRPTEYGYSGFGFSSRLQFPSVKLLDYSIETLEQSTNPFAVIIPAHLETQATRRNPQGRYQSKMRLVRRLYDRGYSRNEILELFRFIEWMMTLPEDLANEFKTELRRYEEERRMPYITSFEREGIQKGTLQASREAVIKVLETRFKTVPSSVIESVERINELDRIKALLPQAVTVASIAEFEQVLKQEESES